VSPEGWSEEKGQGMRLATFISEGQQGRVECSLISLSGMAGGLEANINRWVGQLGSDPMAPDVLADFISSQEVFTTDNGHEGVLVDLTPMAADGGTGEAMMIGVVEHEGVTVFAKLTGTVDALRDERTKLLALCRSFN
jgi:hypothetical protein